MTDPTFILQFPAGNHRNLNLEQTDDVLRYVYGDTPKATALLMQLSNGNTPSLTFKLQGKKVKLTRKQEQHNETL